MTSADDTAGVRRVGVMGGTFDPIHHGHLVAAATAAAECALDEVVFVPAGRPWQKAGGGVSPAEDRYVMTVLATAAHPRFTVSRVDIDRPGETYAVDTLRDLRDRYGPETELFFITGADTLANVTTWRAVDEVFAAATFVTVNRPGHSGRDVSLPPHARVEWLEMPAMDISSTDCRQRVASGRPIWFLTPEAVVRYVDSRGLYRTARALQGRYWCSRPGR
ncbi:nicotinate-nucleotide adenylyltransferase [Stackebrandtia albiflava]|uniref:Probable nicotinate-nucleotide adenylyltransferase n=1 Tax=Stackebrandtia albiflava TaxID=406432 RepID=A0A562VG40_9ACTN|nr:nicotinate-nucleotide adenylyltransferase [Stackebrandtia albiflava]TWJ16893.1 nicotinate-nucleotide adenylyltransferase [Stackebrandtia albiflava]